MPQLSPQVLEYVYVVLATSALILITAIAHAIVYHPNQTMPPLFICMTVSYVATTPTLQAIITAPGSFFMRMFQLAALVIICIGLLLFLLAIFTMWFATMGATCAYMASLGNQAIAMQVMGLVRYWVRHMVN